MNYTPLNYQQLNKIEGTYIPSAVKNINNRTYMFWERSLFQRACSVLDFTLPEEWQGTVRDFFLYCMFKFGYVCISENDQFGKFFQPGNFGGGFDFYYQPTNFIISNPIYQKTLKIGTECEILKLTPDYMGAWDCISYFAEKLSVLDNAINMSLINNKYSLIMGARTKGAAEALKKMVDKINRGEPAVFFNKTLVSDEDDSNDPFFSLDRDMQKSYITDRQLSDFQTLINLFDAEVGIPTLPYTQKKERMVTDEASMKTIDGMSRSQVWFETLTSSIKNVKKLYPDIVLDVKLRYDQDVTPQEMEVQTDGNS